MLTETRPLEARAFLDQAVERMQRGQFEAAIGDLRAALRTEPENPWVLSQLGVCLAHIGRFSDGLDACKRAVRLAPNDTLCRVNLGRAYKIRGDKAAAHRTFASAWQENREHPAPAAELARMGVRRRPVLPFLRRSHWCNVLLGRMRSHLARSVHRS